MTVDIHLPFILSAASSLLALVLIVALWRGSDVLALDRRSFSDENPVIHQSCGQVCGHLT